MNSNIPEDTFSFPTIFDGTIGFAETDEYLESDNFKKDYLILNKNINKAVSPKIKQN